VIGKFPSLTIGNRELPHASGGSRNELAIEIRVFYDSAHGWQLRNRSIGGISALRKAHDGKTLMRSGKTEKQDHEIPIGKSP
jgi:hypothetical protein